MLNEAIEIIQKSVQLPLSYFVSPNKRIYFLYLFTSLLIAFFVYFKKERNIKSVIKYLFSKQVWLSETAFVDYFFFLFNGFIKIIFITPFLVYSLKIAFYTKENLITYFGYIEMGLGKPTYIVLYTIVVFLAIDFSTYVLHLLEHKIPFFWQFHKVHHSATNLNPITQYRLHPVELILMNLKNIAVVGFCMGFFEYLAGNVISPFTLMGVNIFSFLFFVLGANLRHSEIEFKYPGFLENILISPYQHQIHHSGLVHHYDKNMGSHLAIWDWLFGTLLKSKHIQDLKYGIGDENSLYATWYQNLFNPFLWVFKTSIKPIRIKK